MLPRLTNSAILRYLLPLEPLSLLRRATNVDIKTLVTELVDNAKGMNEKAGNLVQSYRTSKFQKMLPFVPTFNYLKPDLTECDTANNIVDRLSVNMYDWLQIMRRIYHDECAHKASRDLAIQMLKLLDYIELSYIFLDGLKLLLPAPTTPSSSKYDEYLQLVRKDMDVWWSQKPTCPGMEPEMCMLSCRDLAILFQFSSTSTIVLLKAEDLQRGLSRILKIAC